MNFTETQADILANAYPARPRRAQQVLERWAYPDAVELEEAGWLERGYVDASGDWSWHWPRHAESALDLNALAASATGPGSQN